MGCGQQTTNPGVSGDRTQQLRCRLHAFLTTLTTPGKHVTQFDILFVAYVEQQLAPTLRAGDVVVVDNLACHKRAGARQVVEAAGAFLLFLPPYSPDLNPIELAFAKPNRALRAAGERTVDRLWTFLGAAVNSFTPDECRSYLRHCGSTATAG